MNQRSDGEAKQYRINKYEPEAIVNFFLNNWKQKDELHYLAVMKIKLRLNIWRGEKGVYAGVKTGERKEKVEFKKKKKTLSLSLSLSQVYYMLQSESLPL